MRNLLGIFGGLYRVYWSQSNMGIATSGSNCLSLSTTVASHFRTHVHFSPARFKIWSILKSLTLSCFSFFWHSIFLKIPNLFCNWRCPHCKSQLFIPKYFISIIQNWPIRTNPGRPTIIGWGSSLKIVHASNLGVTKSTNRLYQNKSWNGWKERNAHIMRYEVWTLLICGVRYTGTRFELKRKRPWSFGWLGNDFSGKWVSRKRTHKVSVTIVICCLNIL